MLETFFDQTAGGYASTNQRERREGTGFHFTLDQYERQQRCLVSPGPRPSARGGGSGRQTYSFKHTFKEDPEQDNLWLWGKAGTNSGRLHNIVAITMKVCERLEPD